MRISVIIPVLNEADVMGESLSQFQHAQDVDVMVVDGGSVDETCSIVKASGFGQWIEGALPGRATQMNFGASHARGEIFLFLHADTFLPDKGLDLIRNTLQDPAVVGGCFRLGFSENYWPFRSIAYFSNLRSKYLGITYGDQGIFVRRSVFEAVGGYARLKLFEDSEFCKAVSQQGSFVMLPESVCSSTRRWRKCGIVRTVFWMWMLRVLFLCSVSDETLCRWYRAVR